MDGVTRRWGRLQSDRLTEFWRAAPGFGTGAALSSTLA